MEALQTVRKQIVSLLSEEDLTAMDISHLVRIPEKDVAGHLSHIHRSLGSTGKKLIIEPYSCMSCGYQFKKRDRFDRPGRCPQCKGSHIRLASYRIL
ncbi:MAG: transcriptional regulator [Desulfobulbaceae bacterium]|uniref:Transcriptional regulator n=1 Tax=Candidatus Desulfobia pelagia TaxID=2841692 RepID=A0A8J6NAP8_9BACT|nr:transcriptional regulator [Candidatus Desulfobia pelagia]